jgi:hypothetical protein
LFHSGFRDVKLRIVRGSDAEADRLTLACDPNAHLHYLSGIAAAGEEVNKPTLAALHGKFLGQSPTGSTSGR